MVTKMIVELIFFLRTLINITDGILKYFETSSIDSSFFLCSFIFLKYVFLLVYLYSSIQLEKLDYQWVWWYKVYL